MTQSNDTNKNPGGQAQLQHSSHFSCGLLPSTKPNQPPYTILICKAISFPALPLVLTAAELRQLRDLLNVWDETGGQDQPQAERLPLDNPPSSEQNDPLKDIESFRLWFNDPDPDRDELEF